MLNEALQAKSSSSIFADGPQTAASNTTQHLSTAPPKPAHYAPFPNRTRDSESRLRIAVQLLTGLRRRRHSHVVEVLRSQATRRNGRFKNCSARSMATSCRYQRAEAANRRS
eukprot:6206345-Pleurochrysis_carterae.AAC.1